jgi:hypothetical protein
MKKIIFFSLGLIFYTGCGEQPVNYESDIYTGSLLKSFPEIIPLPDGFGPEGIESGRGTTFFVGSLATGEIYKGDYRTGAGDILVEASSRLALGLSYDTRNDYLFAAGGATGSLYVYNGTTGELIAEYDIPGSSFINDLVVTQNTVYMTDSFRPFFYMLPLGQSGSLPPSGTVEEIALSGDYVFITGNFNSNGIVASPNGMHLLIINSVDGNLYKVDPVTGYANSVDLGGAGLVNGDGILLINHTLYVVQNFLNQVAEVHLNPDFLSGTLEEVITNPNFEIPATIARFGNSLYAVNARFGLPPGPYNIVKVDR